MNASTQIWDGLNTMSGLPVPTSSSNCGRDACIKKCAEKLIWGTHPHQSSSVGPMNDPMTKLCRFLLVGPPCPFSWSFTKGLPHSIFCQPQQALLHSIGAAASSSNKCARNSASMHTMGRFRILLVITVSVPQINVCTLAHLIRHVHCCFSLLELRTSSHTANLGRDLT